MEGEVWEGQRHPSPGEAGSFPPQAWLTCGQAPGEALSVTWSPLLSGCDLAGLFDLSELQFPLRENEDEVMSILWRLW